MRMFLVWNMCLCVCQRLRIYVYAFVFVCEYTSMFTNACLCLRMCVCVYECRFMCVFVTNVCLQLSVGLILYVRTCVYGSAHPSLHILVIKGESPPLSYGIFDLTAGSLNFIPPASLPHPGSTLATFLMQSAQNPLPPIPTPSFVSST